MYVVKRVIYLGRGVTSNVREIRSVIDDDLTFPVITVRMSSLLYPNPRHPLLIFYKICLFHHINYYIVSLLKCVVTVFFIGNAIVDPGDTERKVHIVQGGGWSGFNC